MKKTNGFTLIELVVGILCSALVTGAVITFLLMGMNTTQSVLDANADQRNAKIVISMMENLTSEGSISTVDYIGTEDEENRDWSLLDKSNAPILSYSGSSQSLRGRNGAVLMEGVLSSSVSISKSAETPNGCLLTFSLETASENYNASVYCRVADIDTDGMILDKQNAVVVPDETLKDDNDPTFISPSVVAARLTFLQKLTSQYNSRGKIDGTGIPYSLWYNNGAYPQGWNENTPWCACFLSWALDQVKNSLISVPRYANVDNFWAHFQQNGAQSPDYNFLPGDLVFFDWNNDESLDHVGAIISKDTQYIYTIEGNSGNRVALRRYALNDPSIYGYGVLDWAT